MEIKMNDNNDMNVSDFNKDKVMSRVRKMLALANDAGASEGERDNALRMAHATLAKYNLSLSEAEAAGKTTEEKREQGATESRNMPWARHAANYIGKLFFCKYFFVRMSGGKVQHYFVGRQSNVVTAKEITDYVIKSIMKEANARKKTSLDPHAFWLNFAKGAAQAVCDKCDALMCAAEQQTCAPGTSLVLASVYRTEMAANVALLNEMGLKLKTSASREKNPGSDGYHAGKAFGSGLSLNRQVGTSNGPAPRRLK